MGKKESKELSAVRQVFPEVCKWYMPEATCTRDKAEVVSEVMARSKHYQEQGISPCEDCPLCAGEHEH